MDMKELGPKRLTYEQTVSFPLSYNQEDTWSHNDTSERIDNQK